MKDDRYQKQIDAGYRRLSFGPSLEQEYQQDLLSRAVMPAVGMAIVCALSIAGIAVFLVTTVPLNISAIPAVTHALIMLPATLVAIVLAIQAHRNNQYRHVLAITPLLVAIVGMGISMAGGRVAGMAHFPYEGFLILIMLVTLLMALPFRHAIVMVLFACLVYGIGVLIAETSTQQVMMEVLHIVIIAIMSLVGGYLLEFRDRGNFLNAKALNALAVRDGLTGLYNRRFFDERMQQLWKMAVREKRGLAIAMLDIDHFKDYNDHYGHLQGDACLRQVADLLVSSPMRPLDLAARIGGEEFAVVWFEADESILPNKAESLCEGFRRAAIPHEKVEVGIVTISIGAVHLKPTETMQLNDYIKMADDALYAAKAAGRNQANSRHIQVTEVA